MKRALCQTPSSEQTTIALNTFVRKWLGRGALTLMFAKKVKIAVSGRTFVENDNTELSILISASRFPRRDFS